MVARHSRAAIRGLLLTIGAAVLSGCGGAVLNGLYFLETPRLTFANQSFDGYEERQWSYGPNYAITNEPYPGNAEVILRWELWESYAPGIGDNGFGHDFRIVLDSVLVLSPEAEA